LRHVGFPVSPRDYRGLTASAFSLPWRSAGDAWHAQVITADRDGVYRIRLEVPEQGYDAYLVEFTLPGVAGLPQIYTTSVFITPDEEPYEIESPLGEPRTLGYWQKQLDYLRHGRAIDYSLEDFQEMLPIRVLGQYIQDAASLSLALSKPGAESQCTAARLNVQAGEMGWYTTLYVTDGENVKFWQNYELAEQYHAAGTDVAASQLCRLLTEYR
ncbi:MAG: hypothetical protein ABW095_09255, partial [Candidatus Thiodiazotropha sp.]